MGFSPKHPTNLSIDAHQVSTCFSASCSIIPRPLPPPVFNCLQLGLCMRISASRQCTDYVCTSYAGAGEAGVAHVTFAVGLGEVEAVWCL